MNLLFIETHARIVFVEQRKFIRYANAKMHFLLLADYVFSKGVLNETLEITSSFYF